MKVPTGQGRQEGTPALGAGPAMSDQKDPGRGMEVIGRCA
jgi:hypothetical protein